VLLHVVHDDLLAHGQEFLQLGALSLSLLLLQRRLEHRVQLVPHEVSLRWEESEPQLGRQVAHALRAE